MAGAGSGRTALEVAGGKLHGASVHDQKRRIVMALTVAGFVTGGTKIDTTEAVDVSYPGFFQHDDRKAGGGEIGGQRILKEQCSGEKIE
jgi:5-enolpyruvylshikimate-3-phosphate synthase